MYEHSEGLFNISIGAQLEKDGYGMSHQENSSVSRDLSRDIAVSKNEVTLAPHLRIDFGGFGKGWLVDKVHDLLNSMGVLDHIVNGGGDIRVGEGAQEIHVENPLHEGYALGTLTLCNEAFAGSSNLKRTWKTPQGKRKAHIISPRRDALSDDVVQLCVRAKTCLEADTYATIGFLQAQASIAKLESQTSRDFAVIYSDGRVTVTPGFGLRAI